MKTLDDSKPARLRSKAETMTEPLNFLIIEKPDNEQYLFVYDDNNFRATLQQIGRYAADPGHSITWCDAAKLSERMTKMRNEEPIDAPWNSRF